MSRRSFETIPRAEMVARRTLPPSVYLAIAGGQGAGHTMRDNVVAFEDLGFAPRIADNPVVRDLSTTVFGQNISMPVVLSPAGAHAVHPDGEVAVARAAKSHGVAMGLSSFATRSIEEVTAIHPQVYYQLYWAGTRDEISARVERARAAGAVGLILTTDWCFATGRDWGSPRVPRTLSLGTMVRFAPEALRRPTWLARFLRAGVLPNFKVPNFGPPDGAVPTMTQAFATWQATPPPTWDDIAWLVREWGGPFMAKGVMRSDDALCAIDAGATAISVSNHGGNNLDTTPAPLRVLAEIRQAVGDQAEVLLDGGVRRGTDVAKAIALGANAAMIGRPYLWGLAADGQRGVELTLEILRKDLDATLMALGRRTPAELCPDDVLVPVGFHAPRALAEPAEGTGPQKRTGEWL